MSGIDSKKHVTSPELEAALETIRSTMKESLLVAQTAKSDQDYFNALKPVYKTIQVAMVVAWTSALKTGDYSGVAKAAFAALEQVAGEKEQLRVLAGFKQYIRSNAGNNDKALSVTMGLLVGKRDVVEIVKNAFMNKVFSSMLDFKGTAYSQEQQDANLRALYDWMHANLPKEQTKSDPDTLAGQYLSQSLHHYGHPHTSREASTESASAASSREDVTAGEESSEAHGSSHDETPEPVETRSPEEIEDDRNFFLSLDEDEQKTVLEQAEGLLISVFNFTKAAATKALTALFSDDDDETPTPPHA